MEAATTHAMFNVNRASMGSMSTISKMEVALASITDIPNPTSVHCLLRVLHGRLDGSLRSLQYGPFPLGTITVDSDHSGHPRVAVLFSHAPNQPDVEIELVNYTPDSTADTGYMLSVTATNGPSGDFSFIANMEYENGALVPEDSSVSIAHADLNVLDGCDLSLFQEDMALTFFGITQPAQ
ncbi:hypothetical protein GHT06_003876 [Daphnia sinensis]|uniref:Uncharacterized protein n=1 Tax=Daphnia sinensis TaxID=1820382 RepID=A0AAD5PNK7_9CRUS|nr:hypothetical protein GHT06_003876 [Daphnia sinensis]